MFLAEAQQYHVYTLQPLANPMQRNTPGSILTQQQQQYIHEQQELKGITVQMKIFIDERKNNNKKLVDIIYTCVQIIKLRCFHFHAFQLLRSFKWFATKVRGCRERYKLRKSNGICDAIVVISANSANHNDRWFSECDTTDAILNGRTTIFCDKQRCEIYGSSPKWCSAALAIRLLFIVIMPIINTVHILTKISVFLRMASSFFPSFFLLACVCNDNFMFFFKLRLF